MILPNKISRSKERVFVAFPNNKGNYLHADHKHFANRIPTISTLSMTLKRDRESLTAQRVGVTGVVCCLQPASARPAHEDNGSSWKDGWCIQEEVDMPLLLYITIK